MPDLEELKKRRDQLTARIKHHEIREAAQARKRETKIKLLVGAAILSRVKKKGGLENSSIIQMMTSYLTRDTDIKDVLGTDGTGSEILKRLTQPDEGENQSTESPVTSFQE
uniref:hypothetical protein n=1 Tax=Pseudomonas sp. TaxID=306 RepID=UPI0010AF462B|nr:hypothetical protein [Pseudomonas sp.]QBM91762.1 mobilization protein MobC [Pseudomonas sp.]